MKPGKHPFSSKNVKKDICNLDCTRPKKKGKQEKDDVDEDQEDKRDKFPQIHTFRGPVKVVVVDPPDDPATDCKITASAFIAVANLAIGANFIIFVVNTFGFIYSMSINAHMILCALGLQVFLPLSILIHNPLYGASGPLSESERTWAHCKFLVMAVICVGVGEYLGNNSLNKPKSVLAKLAAEKLPFNKLHRMFGNIATYIFAPALLTGIALKVLKVQNLIALTDDGDDDKEPKIITIVNIAHTVFGFATLVAANVSFAISLFAPLFQIYMYYNSYLAPTIIMIVLVAFYTIIMMVIRGSSHRD